MFFWDVCVFGASEARAKLASEGDEIMTPSEHALAGAAVGGLGLGGHAYYDLGDPAKLRDLNMEIAQNRARLMRNDPGVVYQEYVGPKGRGYSFEGDKAQTDRIMAASKLTRGSHAMTAGLLGAGAGALGGYLVGKLRERN